MKKVNLSSSVPALRRLISEAQTGANCFWCHREAWETLTLKDVRELKELISKAETLKSDIESLYESLRDKI